VYWEGGWGGWIGELERHREGLTKGRTFPFSTCSHSHMLNPHMLTPLHVHTPTCSTLTCSHSHMLTPSHAHLHMLTPPHAHTLTCSHPHMLTPSHAHIPTCSHPHMFTSTCSHPHMFTSTCSHPHMFTLPHAHLHAGKPPSSHVCDACGAQGVDAVAGIHGCLQVSWQVPRVLSHW